MRNLDFTANAPSIVLFSPSNSAAQLAAAAAAPPSAPVSSATTPARHKLKPKIGLKVYWITPTTAAENEKAEIVSKSGKG